MRQQGELFTRDRTHEQLVRSEKQAHDAYMKANKLHRGRKAANLIWRAIVRVKLKYETDHGLVSKTDNRKAAA